MIKFTTDTSYVLHLREINRLAGDLPAYTFPLCNAKGVLSDQVLVLAHAGEDGYITPESSLEVSEALDRLYEGELSRVFIACCHPNQVKDSEPWVQDDRVTVAGYWDGLTGAGWEVRSTLVSHVTVFSDQSSGRL